MNIWRMELFYLGLKKIKFKIREIYKLWLIHAEDEDQISIFRVRQVFVDFRILGLSVTFRMVLYFQRMFL